MARPEERRKGRSVWPGKEPPDHLIAHQPEVRLPVRADFDGMRLDMFLKTRLSWRSRESVHRLLEQRDVRVDGVKRKAAYRLKRGEIVVVPCPEPDEDPESMRDIEIDILYEDDELVVLNKQPNVVVHPAGKYRYSTLINALHLRYRRPDDPERDIQPKLGHRLDKETSGVLVVCKTDAARRFVSMEFETGAVVKEYLAVVEGEVEPDGGLIDAPLGPAPDHIHGLKMGVRADGLDARTRYVTLDRQRGLSLVRARLLTGRSHQIRVHLLHIGHPILCDKHYSPRHVYALSDARPLADGEADRTLLDRQALHAWRTVITHPRTREPLELVAPLPRDMADVIRETGLSGGVEPSVGGTQGFGEGSSWGQTRTDTDEHGRGRRKP